MDNNDEDDDDEDDTDQIRNSEDEADEVDNSFENTWSAWFVQTMEEYGLQLSCFPAFHPRDFSQLATGVCYWVSLVLAILSARL